MKTNRRHLVSLLAAAAACAPLPSWAAPFPERNLRIIVPVPPGGLTDILARALAQQLGSGLGQAVIVENKPGASSIIGTDYVLKQPADGYTLLLTWTAVVQNPLLYANATYDPVKDFIPVARL